MRTIDRSFKKNSIRRFGAKRDPSSVNTIGTIDSPHFYSYLLKMGQVLPRNVLLNFS